jgi:hypothetical protein
MRGVDAPRMMPDPSRVVAAGAPFARIGRSGLPIPAAAHDRTFVLCYDRTLPRCRDGRIEIVDENAVIAL